jgi:acetyl-CoA synthetase
VATPTLIRKQPHGERVKPNLRDYEAARRSFTWTAARAELDGLPAGRGLNIAHEAVDRHAAGPRADRVALRCSGRDGRRTDVTYAELASASSRFAHVLARLGVRPGERVFGMCDSRPELFAAVLGTLKRRAVFCPLFPAFGPEPARQRLELGDARVLVTTPDIYLRRIEPVRSDLPGLRHVLLVTDPGDTRVIPARETSTHSWPRPTTRGRSRRRRRRIPRCCTSPAGRPADPRAQCTCMRR